MWRLSSLIDGLSDRPSRYCCSRLLYELKEAEFSGEPVKEWMRQGPTCALFTSAFACSTTGVTKSTSRRLLRNPNPKSENPPKSMIKSAEGCTRRNFLLTFWLRFSGDRPQLRSDPLWGNLHFDLHIRSIEVTESSFVSVDLIRRPEKRVFIRVVLLQIEGYNY